MTRAGLPQGKTCRHLVDCRTPAGATNVRVFGSAARGEAGPGSDIDSIG